MSRGSIITLQDGLYQFELPSVPPDREIWYYDVPKRHQYWKTPENKNHKWLAPTSEIRNVKQMTERDRREYIDYWRNVWENGLWIMINGEPTWLSGMHVEHLIFNKFKSKYFIYLDSQRLRFYFRKLTDEAVLCDGRLWVKGRRVGITAEQITANIRCLIDDFANFTALQSDTHDKAKSTLLSKIIDTYIKRPDWMRETLYCSNGKVPRALLELIDVTIRQDDNYPLGGSARAFPSTSKALDGEEFMLVTMDELSKWIDVSPYETFEINKKTIINPGKRGKLDALSTTGDSKEAQKAIRDWHKLISDSNPKVLNENGQTNSGLWYYFVSYIHSLELLEKKPEIKDIYGNINREMAEEFIWNDVKKYPKDSKEYIYSLYKQPMEMRHALLTPTGQGYFSKIRITHRLDILRAMPKDKKPYVRGRLEYDQRENVYFEADEYGHWLIALHPYYSTTKNIDTRNRYRVMNGVFFPPINPEFGIGYDPIRYKKEDTSSNHLSEAAIIVYKKFDYFNSGECNQYAGLYLYRPDDPRDANKEGIKACKYFGAPMMHERVIESVKEDFEEAHCLPFLQKSEKDGLYGLWIDGGGKIVKNALDIMVAQFSPPKTPEDKDQIAEMPFEDVLTDLDTIDISNTTSSDVFMAMVELTHGLKQLTFTNNTDNTARSMRSIINEIITPRN